MRGGRERSRGPSNLKLLRVSFPTVIGGLPYISVFSLPEKNPWLSILEWLSAPSHLKLKCVFLSDCNEIIPSPNHRETGM